MDDPLAGLAEVRRVVKPGGLVAASSIEYGGLILHGQNEPLLRRFYELRLRLWEAQGDVHFYRGRELRGLLLGAGFVAVEAFTIYFSYGTEERVRTFGLRRAADCEEEWYVDGLKKHRLADEDEIDALKQAWIRWAGHSTRLPPLRGGGPLDGGPDRRTRTAAGALGTFGKSCPPAKMVSHGRRLVPLIELTGHRRLRRRGRP